MAEQKSCPAATQYYLDSCLEHTEITRLDLQHQMWLYLLDGALYTAPVRDIENHLDIGCGSGVWTTALAKSSPATDVLAIDLTPPTPQYPPDNLTFLRADAEQPWAFTRKDTYDLITARVLVSSIQDWSRLFHRCRTHLRPHGWIEVADVTIGTFSEVVDWRDETSPLMRWYQCYRRVAGVQGIDGWANHKHAERLRDAGFTRVRETFFTCYLSEDVVQSESDKQVARLTRQNALGLLEAVTKVMVERAQWHVLGMRAPQLNELMLQAQEDIIQNATARRYHWT